jgi:thiamine-phosphate pyrophosphorylase
MLSLSIPPLYAILDPEQTKGRTAERVLYDLLEGGVTFLQLRVKSLPASDFFELARHVRAATQFHGCKLIVNDRVDVALACDADGVHLGQDDLPLAVGRKLMGQKIVGISTHDLEQAQEAEQNGADYIGFGPMFGTTTKNTGFTARGVERLRQIRAAVKLPIVAIGGITEQNVTHVWQAGADSVAIISDMSGADDIVSKARRIISAHTSA